jgi:phosphoglycolate phosphatase
MKHHAVVFDLDGTLLDTIQDLAEACNQALAEMGLAGHKVAEYKYFVGEGREEMVSKALPAERRDAVSVHRMVDSVNRYYAVHWCDHTRPFEGIPELLDALTFRKVILSIFSNKPQEFTSQNVTGLLDRWHFALVLGASDSVPKKPDCTAALRIARELKLEPSDFLYLGDSGLDMQTARSSGMLAVGALWGFRTRQELLENGAQALVSRPQELLELL